MIPALQICMISFPTVRQTGEREREKERERTTTKHGHELVQFSLCQVFPA